MAASAGKADGRPINPASRAGRHPGDDRPTTIKPTTRENRMDVTSLVTFLAIGAIAGWLAGVIMKGGGFGLAGNI